MDTHFYEGPGNIIIDDCSRCFLNWLDQGELMRVVHAPDHVYNQDRYGRLQR
jgi:Zn-finger nucleic acid-binding protein